MHTLGLAWFISNKPHADAREELQFRDDRRRRGRRGTYAVTYEDGDGDWLLVGDVPWE
jgi:auxin-responsive protein IAA